MGDPADGTGQRGSQGSPAAGERCSGLRTGHLLVNGLQELPLVLADAGVVHLPHQLGVLVDQPRLPENIRRRVFHLRRRTTRGRFN